MHSIPDFAMLSVVWSACGLVALKGSRRPAKRSGGDSDYSDRLIGINLDARHLSPGKRLSR